ncbi:hypothetical protein H9W91_01495 [Streptomyces alfalfae]|uniref:hypothetical protein n=1 Tax=Streptomyces alfalfae TaxID=1642299 RepID=UPI001BAB117E|nr:hypothetical protein [Streptomyces alfalfae]QUI29685.1 hypothetical protein H9W91_01495 [Streptomyces alfalfae]
MIAAGQRRVELLSRAMNVPDSAETVFLGDADLGAPLPPERRRQFLYARVVYENMVL